MKKIGALNLGMAFAGCFLGAGYVSGQELWQFFGSFGVKGAVGLVIAMAALFLVGIMMLELNRLSGIAEIDKLVVRKDIPVLRIAVTVLELLFLFGVCTIMAAGCGALINQLFGIPSWIGSAVLSAAVAYVSLAGLGGMVAAFSATVPLLAAATLVFGIISLSQNGVQLSRPEVSGTNPLMGSWFVAAITFACYNLFGNIAMISPLGEFMKSKKAALGGIAIGTAILVMIAGSVLLSISAQPSLAEAELPMLALALGKGKVIGFVYGVLLLLAMFGTALSSLVGFTSIIYRKSERIKSKKTAFTLVCALAMLSGSLFGFGDLIGVVYPIFGYCSSVFIVLMTEHYIKIKRAGKVNEKIADKARGVGVARFDKHIS